MSKKQERTRRNPSTEKTPRQKMLQRYESALEKAASERLVYKEIRDEYRNDRERREVVRDLLIKDLLRVYQHPDNPYAGWSASRKRYRELGHFPEICVIDLFGTHAEFERAAALRDKRGTSKVTLLTSRLHSEKDIREYAEESVLGSVGRWSKEYRKKSGVKHVLVGSDFHGQFVDPLALRVFLDVAKDVQPDTIVFNGDVTDFPQVSRFSHMPGAGSLSLQDEIDWTKKHILGATRKVAPDAAMLYVIGNHEHRLIRYLADTAPELASLRCLRWDTLFGIDDLDIEMVFGGNFMAPRQRDRQDNTRRRTHAVLYDSVVVTHGRSIADNAMAAELNRWGMSGTSGHTHRPGIQTRPTHANPHLSWTSTPMMAGFAVGKDYVDGPSGWTMGFALFTIDVASKIVIPQLITVYEDFASWNGHVWRPTDAARSVRMRMWGEGGEVTDSKRGGE
jgi:predicted phosphodiesterase